MLMMLCGWCCVDGVLLMVLTREAARRRRGGGGGMEEEKQKPHMAMWGSTAVSFDYCGQLCHGPRSNWVYFQAVGCQSHNGKMDKIWKVGMVSVFHARQK